MKKVLTAVLRILFPAVVFYLLSTKVDFREVISNIGVFGFGNFSAVVLIIFLAQLTSALKFNIIMNSYGKRSGILHDIGVYLEGMFYNNLFFSTFGGDAFRAIVYTARFKEKAPVFSALFWERMLGLLGVFICAAVSVVLRPSILSSETVVKGINLGLPVFLIFAAASVLAVCLFFKPFREILGKLSSKISIFKKAAGRFLEYSAGLGKAVPAFIISVLLSVLFVIIIVFSFLLILKVTSPGLPAGLIWIYIPFILLIAAIPVTISGLGLREWSMIHFFAFINGFSSKENIMSASLIWFFAVFTLSVIGGLIHVLKALVSKKNR